MLDNFFAFGNIYVGWLTGRAEFSERDALTPVEGLAGLGRPLDAPNVTCW